MFHLKPFHNYFNTKPFHFTLKALFVFEILKFGHVGKQPDMKTKFNFKFATSSTETLIITIHILYNISKNKGNQTTKFGQLIEYNNTRNTFFWKNHTQNAIEKVVSDPFQKNQNWAYLRVNSLKFYRIFFHHQNMLKLWCWRLAFNPY